MKTKPQVSFGHVSLDIDTVTEALYGVSVRPVTTRKHMSKDEALVVLKYHNRDANDVDSIGICQSLERQVSRMEGIQISMEDGKYFA